jgi:hypothetical protein
MGFLPPGPVGPEGPRGPVGPQGPQGVPGLSSVPNYVYPSYVDNVYEIPATADVVFANTTNPGRIWELPPSPAFGKQIILNAINAQSLTVRASGVSAEIHIMRMNRPPDYSQSYRSVEVPEGYMYWQLTHHGNGVWFLAVISRFGGIVQGLVPAVPVGFGMSYYLRSDGQWALPTRSVFFSSGEEYIVLPGDSIIFVYTEGVAIRTVNLSGGLNGSKITIVGLYISDTLNGDVRVTTGDSGYLWRTNSYAGGQNVRSITSNVARPIIWTCSRSGGNWFIEGANEGVTTSVVA